MTRHEAIGNMVSALKHWINEPLYFESLPRWTLAVMLPIFLVAILPIFIMAYLFGMFCFEIVIHIAHSYFPLLGHAARGMFILGMLSGAYSVYCTLSGRGPIVSYETRSRFERASIWMLALPFRFAMRAHDKPNPVMVGIVKGLDSEMSKSKIQFPRFELYTRPNETIFVSYTALLVFLLLVSLIPADAAGVGASVVIRAAIRLSIPGGCFPVDATELGSVQMQFAQLIAWAMRAYVTAIGVVVVVQVVNLGTIRHRIALAANDHNPADALTRMFRSEWRFLNFHEEALVALIIRYYIEGRYNEADELLDCLGNVIPPSLVNTLRCRA